MAIGTAAAPAWRLQPPLLRKAAILAAAAFVPLVVAYLVLGMEAAVGAGLGVAIGLTAGLLLRPLPAIGVVAINIGAALAGTVVAGSPLAAAAVVLAAGLLLGPANRRGYGRPLLLLPMLASIATTGMLAGDLLRGLGGLALGAGWAIMLASVVAAPRPPEPLDLRSAWTHAIVLAVTTSVATFASLAIPLPHGYWIVVTLCAVLVPSADEQGRAVAERTAGTITGALVAVMAGVLLPTPLLGLVALGSIVLMVAYAMAGRGKHKVIWLTVFVVLLLGGLGGDATVGLAVQRLAWTIAGAGMVVVASAVVAALDRRPAAVAGASS